MRRCLSHQAPTKRVQLSTYTFLTSHVTISSTFPSLAPARGQLRLQPSLSLSSARISPLGAPEESTSHNREGHAGSLQGLQMRDHAATSPLLHLR